MNNYLIMDAISYLDADMLAVHLQKKEQLQSRSQTIKRNGRLKWSVVAAIFSAFVIACVMTINMPNVITPPNYSELVWDTSYENGPNSLGEESYKVISGLKLTNVLNNAFENNYSENSTFAMCVYIENSDSVDDVKELFERNGIYSEIKNGQLYVFATEKQIVNFKMPLWKNKCYIIDHANENLYYGNTVEVNAVEEDFLNLNYDKFYFNTALIPNLFPSNSGTMYQGYLQLFKELGERNGYLTITIYPSGDNAIGSDYSYIDFYRYNVGVYPKRFAYVIRIDKLTPELFRIMSEDLSIDYVMVSVVVHNMDGENEPTNVTQ